MVVPFFLLPVFLVALLELVAIVLRLFFDVVSAEGSNWTICLTVLFGLPVLLVSAKSVVLALLIFTVILFIVVDSSSSKVVVEY